MVTTVTTTTVTSFAVSASLAALVVVTLLAMLIGKEIIGAGSDKARRTSRALSVAIVPLGLVFITTVLVKIAEVLG